MTRPAERAAAILAALMIFPPLALLVLGPAAPPTWIARAEAQGMGPELPPDFYGSLPDPYPGRDAPEGVKRLAIHYTGCLVGDFEPCG